MILSATTPIGTAQAAAIDGLRMQRVELQQAIAEGADLAPAAISALVAAYANCLKHRDVAEVLGVSTAALVASLTRAAQVVIGIQNAQRGDLLLERGAIAKPRVVRSEYDFDAPTESRFLGLCDPSPDYDYNLWTNDFGGDPRELRVVLVRPQ